jgi:hypothetical protein
MQKSPDRKSIFVANLASRIPFCKHIMISMNARIAWFKHDVGDAMCISDRTGLLSREEMRQDTRVRSPLGLYVLMCDFASAMLFRFCKPLSCAGCDFAFGVIILWYLRSDQIRKIKTRKIYF